MMSARPSALACPRCGSRLPATSPAFLDCPACASVLAVYLPVEPVREAVLPAQGREEAVAAARTFWERKWVPEGFAADATLEEPVLLFAPFHEVERTVSTGEGRGASVSDGLVRSPAVKIPGVPLSDIDVVAALEKAPRVPFDPVALQRRGVVFDPSEKRPDPASGKVLEERLALVWVPVWLVRCRFTRNLYEVAVDGTTGAVLAGRAPTERSARLREAIGFVYLLAFLVGMPLWIWGRILYWIIGTFEDAGIVIALAIPPLLVSLLAFSWDRMRFRYEWVGDGRAVKLVAINRPEKTLPEKVRDRLLQLLQAVASA